MPNILGFDPTGGADEDGSDCNACARITILEGDMADVLISITAINETIDGMEADIETLQENQDEYLLPTRTYRAKQSWSNAAIRAGDASNTFGAPGFAGAIAIPHKIVMVMKYPGSSPWTSSPIIVIGWLGPSSVLIPFQELDTNTEFWQATNNTVHFTDLSARVNTTHVYNTVNCPKGMPLICWLKDSTAPTGGAVNAAQWIEIMCEYSQFDWNTWNEAFN